MNKPTYLSDLTTLREFCDSYTLSSVHNRLPLIGVSANLENEISTVKNDYTNSIIAGGGIPVILPVHTDLAILEEMFSSLDGLLLTGGGDINPLFYQEEPLPALGNLSALRDQYDLMLLKMAYDRQLPIFGICRGHQVINIFFGGTLYQDIYSQINSPLLKHQQTAEGNQGTHYVEVAPGSKLKEILGQDKILVNTFHHESNKDIAPGFRNTALSSDGILEASEPLSDTGPQILSVQWHPEKMAAANDPAMVNLFQYFVGQAQLYKKCKQIHTHIYTIDSHVDTPLFFTEDFSIAQRENGAKVSLPKMQEGLLDCIFMAAYLKQGERDEESLRQATERTVTIINQIKQQIEANQEWVGLATCPEDLYYLKRNGKKTFFIGIENGYALGRNIRNVARFQKMGVSYMTLCHNGNNGICDSAKGEPEHNGLSKFGQKVIQEMNRTGIMVDISHVSEKTFYDVIRISRTPVIASHSSAKALCDHPRNLDDDQLRAIASVKGVVQVCLYEGFLSRTHRSTLKDAIQHIDYIVNLIGEDYVGIGSDFDGGGGIEGCNASNEMVNITRELLRLGYSSESIKKIWGGNLLRVMQTVQDYAARKHR
ncbi:membrane dipeptidase [uncultured Odoribacter sp.]|uniref:membrane dipeptidase n=1 Tax=uncultured Odoribacter sp. TaxID=876416 RepID=UPI00262BE74D|nr:membrane dipeptidase [uncultured Odoribacter sp.]